MDWVPLNFGLLKQPLNYLIVGSTLLVALIAYDVVASYITSKGN